jgi:hypothetical protein
MKQAKSYEELWALPFWVTVRTAQGQIRERDQHSGSWSQMGSEGGVGWQDDDFPVTVLWSYADEVKSDDIDPDMAVELVRQLRAAQAQAAAQQAAAQNGAAPEGTSEVADTPQVVDSTGNGEVLEGEVQDATPEVQYRTPQNEDEMQALCGNPQFAHLLEGMRT